MKTLGSSFQRLELKKYVKRPSDPAKGGFQFEQGSVSLASYSRHERESSLRECAHGNEVLTCRVGQRASVSEWKCRSCRRRKRRKNVHGGLLRASRACVAGRQDNYSYFGSTATGLEPSRGVLLVM